MKNLILVMVALSVAAFPVVGQIPPNNLGQIVEVATPAGILPVPHLLIGWDSSGFVRQASAEDSFKVFGWYPNATCLNRPADPPLVPLNFHERFSAPSGNESYEIRYGDSSHYWDNSTLASDKLPFAVYSVGSRSARSQDTSVAVRLCIQKVTPSGYYNVYGDMALPADSTYWDLATRQIIPFPSVINRLWRYWRTGKASIPYTQSTWNEWDDAHMPSPGTVLRLVAQSADSIAPVISAPDSVFFVNRSASYDIHVYSFEPTVLSLASAPEHMTMTQDGVVQWPFTASQAGHRYEVVVTAENSLGSVFNTFHAIAGYACDTAVDSVALLQENDFMFYTGNDGTIARHPLGTAGMLFHNWDLIFAGGFWVGARKPGVTGDTVTVSQVEFESDFQPGRILNRGPLDSLMTQNPDDPANGVYILPDHEECWPAEAPYAGNDPLKLSLRDTWTVFNDMGAHNAPEPGGEAPKLGLEVQRQTFMFAQYPWNNAVLVRMRIINKSDRTYDSTYFALWTDADVGYWSNNDLCFVDSSLGLLCTYSIESDQANLAQGTLLLQGPVGQAGLQDTARLLGIGPSGFVTTELPGHKVRVAGSALAGLKQCYSMNDFFRWSVMQGSDCSGHTKPGGPFDLIAGHNAIDQYNLLSSGPFTFTAGDTQDIWYAYVGALANSDSDAVDTLKHYAMLMHQQFQGDMNDIVVGIGDRTANTVVRDFHLYANYPNPFNPTTTIRYVLPKHAKVSLKVYNVLGQEVRTLVNAREGFGEHTVVWDGRNQLGRPVSSGVYLYRLEVDGKARVRKMMLIR